MIVVQRKFKVIKAKSTKDLCLQVNEIIQREYKDSDGFLFQSSGRWQCLGRPFVEDKQWFQALVFLQEEAN
tara:strand:+ start:499 stop:711 length:213 start_codon:yes stop_codon:yes gene_type:complete